MGFEGAEPSAEPQEGPGGQGFLLKKTGFIGQEMGGRDVAAVEDQIIGALFPARWRKVRDRNEPGPSPPGSENRAYLYRILHFPAVDSPAKKLLT